MYLEDYRFLGIQINSIHNGSLRSGFSMPILSLNCLSKLERDALYVIDGNDRYIEIYEVLCLHRSNVLWKSKLLPDTADNNKIMLEKAIDILKAYLG